MFSYAQVEDALAGVFGVGKDRRGALRGRIKHFQRLGIASSSPGKGRKIEYEKKDVLRWAIALEFAEFGIDPTVIRPALPIVENVLADREDYIWLVFTPNFMSCPAQAERWLHTFVVTDLAGFAAALGKGPMPGQYDPRRLGMIDISRLKRELDLCLDHRSPD